MTTWTTPEFVEIDMSAEIGSYQEEPEPRDDWTGRTPPKAEPEVSSS